MAVPWYLRPDGGRSATRIAPPRSLRISTPRPKAIPVFRQPDGGRYPGVGGQYAKQIKVAAPKRKSPSYKLPSPKLGGPRYSSAATPNFAGGISLPGSNPGVASIYRRTASQLRQMAKEAVMLEANPQLNSLTLAGKQENTNYDVLIGQLRRQLGLSKGDVKGLYDALDISLAVNAKQQNAINADTKVKQGAIYDQLKTDVGANYDKSDAAVKAELARLGMQGQNPAATSRLTADKQFLQGQATTSKANSSALLDAINASTQGMMQGLRAGSASTSAMLQSGLQQQFDKESADSLQKHLAKLAEINMQRNTLKSSLPSKINQTYAALLDQQYQREMDASQKLFDNQIKLGNYQISQQNAQTTQQYRQNQLALEAQRLAQSATKKPAARPLSGVDKSAAFLRQLSAKSHVPYDQLNNLLIDAINGGDGADYPGFQKNLMNRYGNDIKAATAARGYPQLYNDMIRAMQYYFGG